MKKLLAVIITVIVVLMLSPATLANITLTNEGFEDGTLSGWNATVPPGGSAVATTQYVSQGASTLYLAGSGLYFALLKTDGAGSYTSISQSFSAGVGDTISGQAFFDSNDSMPYNDNAAVQIRQDSTVVATVFSSSVAEIGHGETPWTEWSYTFASAGAYSVVARIANGGDSSADSYMGFDIGPSNVPCIVDIKPGTTPNVVNAYSKGALPVAILGTVDLDVSLIDPLTIKLAGVAPRNWSIKDVGAAGDPTAGPDGINDLTLTFDMPAVIAGAGNPGLGLEVELWLVGYLTSGHPIIGSDTILIIQGDLLAETALSLADDGYQEVPIGFAFPYQGQIWRSVFVNANGNLTFGQGDYHYTESAWDLVNGPPRIAALWTDLNPGYQPNIQVTHEKKSMTVTYTNVRELGTSFYNTFSITLRSSGNIEVNYVSCQSLLALAGVSQGNGAADPGEIDLSSARGLSAVGTTYEWFDSLSNSFDLNGKTLVFHP